MFLPAGFFTVSVVIDPPGEPAANMAKDEALAAAVREGRVPATLRIYQWDRPAISIGRRQQIDDLPKDLLAMNVPIVRRPTGGGAVIHQTDELTYSIGFPLPLEGERVRVRGLTPVLHSAIKEVLILRGLVQADQLTLHPTNPAGPAPLCFSTPSCGDILFRGRKVAGSALRVRKDGILLQGSLQGFPVPVIRLREALIEAVQQTFKTQCQPQPLKLPA